MGPEYIRASDGNGEAVRAIVLEQRDPGDMSLIVDSVLNWPHDFIATSGVLDVDTGLLDPDTMCIFYAHLDGTIIMIDDFAPGYSDVGHNINEVLLLKPTTAWADLVAEQVQEPGLPAGGVDGEVLVKQSATDGDAEWEAVTSVALVTNEVIGGTINGVNTIFTLAGSAVTGTVELYKNGVRQNPGLGNDYTVSGSTITMATAPLTGSILLADYSTSTSQFTSGVTGFVTNQIPSGTVNGSNTTFTCGNSYVAGTLEVWINGLKQLPTTHYVETTPTSGVFTMGDAPATGDNVLVNYQHTLSAGIGDADLVDGFHASAVPTANTLLPLNSSGQFPTTIIKNPYRFLAYPSVNQTIVPATTWTKLQMGAELYDTNSNYNTSTWAYTVPLTGYYTFFASAQLLSQAGTPFLISLSKDGIVEYARLCEIPNTTGNISLSGSVELYMTVGETLWVIAYSGTAGKVISAGFNTTRFGGRYEGP